MSKTPPSPRPGPTASSSGTSDEDLLRSLPGFKSTHALANGIRLHYVEGGDGEPVVLLPSWPATWWEFHTVMLALAKKYRVIAVDLRGMGTSDKPRDGYDKKTMAADIHDLVQGLGLRKVNIVGNDIGAMVAYAYAANYPDATARLDMLDCPHPFEPFTQLPLLPPPGALTLDGPERSVHLWWFAFNQVPDLFERVFEGRYHLMQDWVFDYLAMNKSAITSHDRAVYAAAYESVESLRAVRGWFSTFDQDIKDLAGYPKLEMPVLGVGGIAHAFLTGFLAGRAPGALIVKLENTGHWVPDEQPVKTIELITQFVG